jgi:hypothetical protein
MNASDGKRVRVDLKWCQSELGPISLPTGAKHTIVIVRPTVRRLAAGALVYAPGSTLPFGSRLGAIDFEKALAGLAQWLNYAAAEPGLRLAAVGHASSDGNEAENVELSWTRATIAMSIALCDIDSWLQATKSIIPDIDLASIYMWSARMQIGRGHFVDPYHPTRSELAAACRSFQEHYVGASGQTLQVDGQCGEKTLGAMFERVRWSFENYCNQLTTNIHTVQALPRFSVVGVGSKFATASDCTPSIASHEDGRVVDLLLFEPESLSLCNALPVEQVYRGDHVRRVELPRYQPDLRAGKIRLHDHFSQPMGNVAYTLHLGRQQLRGKSDSNGLIEVTLPPTCPDFAVLEWSASEFEASKRYRRQIFLNCRPSTHLGDWRACLHNLGYTGPDMQEVTKSFQRDYAVDDSPHALGLLAQGTPPPASLAKVESIFFENKGRAERARATDANGGVR